MKTVATILLTALSVTVVGGVALKSRVQSSTPRWEYLTLSPSNHFEPGLSRWRHVYSACHAAESDWKCRRFEPVELGSTTPDPLKDALFTLGQERWEMVAVFEAQDGGGRMSYMFKRRLD